jgi:GNAT superfamily N-acetyltransferase
MEQIIPLIMVLNPDAKKADLEKSLQEMRAEGYRCVGAWKGGKLLGISGFWVGTRFWCEKFIEPDNVVVLPEARGLGIGTKLMEWIEAEGKHIGCSIIKLEAYATNIPAHKLYFSVDYLMPGKVFIKPLKMTSKEWLSKMDVRVPGASQ